MQITFSRSGGLAGLRLQTTVRETELSARQAARLRRLVEAADCFQLPQRVAADRRQPDRFQYGLTLEDGERRHTVMIDEAAAGPALQQLLAWLTELARAR